MLGPIGHLAALAAYGVRRGAQVAHDLDAHRELAWDRAASPGLPPGLELAWLGTAGFRLSYQGQHLLIDPYLTRLSLGDVVRRRVVPADPARLAAVPDPLAILVGHTHFDHALDVPALARRAGCPVYGSASLARLMALHGQPERAVTVEPHRVYRIGPFAVTFVPSLHSKLAGGLWTPSSGELTCEHVDQLTPQAYRCGQVWGIHVDVAGCTLYHQGSCDLLDGELRHKGVDVLLCGIAGRRFTRRYVARLLRGLEPRLIVPHHFDDFFRPLDAPLAMSLNVNLAGFVDEVGAVSRDFTVRTLGLGQVIGSAPS
ncbi:MAG: MBL fold metallo-hydrolase [Myxococcales bacterium]|nr:MBL fold metallo-hydrolase [Myxococcales bacterium]